MISGLINLIELRFEGSPSDHSPLLLVPEQPLRGSKQKHFKFENAWLTESTCFQIIKDRWEEDPDGNVMQKVERCAESLEIWGREVTGNFGK